MDKNLISLLLNLGLSEKETKIYLSALELGSAPASAIAKQSGIDRVNTYYLLESLKQKGLISETEKSAVKQFNVESPEQLLRLGEENKKKISETVAQINGIIPELLSQYKTTEKHKPLVRFYQGKNGYLNVYETILGEKPKEFLVLMDYEPFKKLVDEVYEREWVKKRIALGIHIRWLAFETLEMKKEQEQKEMSREIRFLPKSYIASGGVIAYNEKLIFLSTGNEFMAVVIESNEFSNLAKTLFEILWGFVGK